MNKTMNERDTPIKPYEFNECLFCPKCDKKLVYLPAVYNGRIMIYTDTGRYCSKCGQAIDYDSYIPF